MRLLIGSDEFVASFVIKRMKYLHELKDFGPYTAIGILDHKERLIAGLVYHNYIPLYGNIEITMASDSPKWATVNNIKSLLKYPFIQLNCNRVTTITPKKFRRARRLNEGLGFKFEGCLRKGFSTDDAVIMGLMKEDWLSSKYATGE